MITREWLPNALPGRVSERRGNVEWPPRNTKLTSFEIFLWGYPKEKVYAWKPWEANSVEALITRGEWLGHK